MNSRERIIANIEHKETDIIPVDFGSTRSSGISAIGYINLKQYLGIHKGSARVYDVVQQLARVEDEILDKFCVDALDVGIVYDEEENWYDFTLPSGYVVQFPGWFKPTKDEEDNVCAFSKDKTMIAKMNKNSFYFSQTCYPYLDGLPENYDNLDEALDEVQWSAIPASPWDQGNINTEDFWRDLRARVIKLRETSDKALLLDCGCSLFETGTYLRRFDNFLMDLYLSPREVEKFFDVLVDRYLNLLDKVCKWLGDVVDIVRFSDDLGMSEAPFMSPEVYQKLLKPRHAALWQYVKKHSNMYVFLHCCGSIYKLLPDLIEAGIDIINPVQISANDMEPQKLKKEFGKDVTFWGGGCDPRILSSVSPKEVRDHVRQQIEIFARDGGFVFNQVHIILPEVPPENIIAMFEAMQEFCK